MKIGDLLIPKVGQDSLGIKEGTITKIGDLCVYYDAFTFSGKVLRRWETYANLDKYFIVINPKLNEFKKLLGEL